MKKTDWEMFVDNGWRRIVRSAVAGVERCGGEITQVKEKFGGLRIYHAGGDHDKIHKIVDAADVMAQLTCENCGQAGKLRSERLWLKTYCDACHADGN